MQWLDKLAVWYLSKRLRVPYGTWVPIYEGTKWQIIEKKPTETGDPLQWYHTVGIKVSKV